MDVMDSVRRRHHSCLQLFFIAAIFDAAAAALSASDDKNYILTATSQLSNYIEYHNARGLPLILAAPHGGLEEPSDIPDREAGCWDSSTSSCVWRHDCGEKNSTKCRAVTVTDGYTADLTRELRDEICDLFDGLCPAVIINLLKRTKLDANRAVEEAAFNNPVAVSAFNTFHSYIDQEKSRIENYKARTGRGLFIDIHGQSHAIERAEVGYLVRGAALDSEEPIDPANTSIRALAAWIQDRVSFDELLRGNGSLGALLEEAGYRAVPSLTDRGPGKGNVYFNGGFNTRVHGSWKEGRVDGIQIESAHSPRMPPNRARYARGLSCAISRYLCLYYVDYINVTSVEMSTQDYESAGTGAVALCSDIEVKCSGYSNLFDTARSVLQLLLIAICCIVTFTL